MTLRSFLPYVFSNLETGDNGKILCYIVRYFCSSKTTLKHDFIFPVAWRSGLSNQIQLKQEIEVSFTLQQTGKTQGCLNDVTFLNS